MFKKFYTKEVLADLYKLAENEYSLVHQWNKPDAGSEYYRYSLEHLTKAEALIETIENAIAMSIGGGVPAFSRSCRTIEKRLNSIKVWLNGSC